jgi:hypothetical protein
MGDSKQFQCLLNNDKSAVFVSHFSQFAYIALFCSFQKH